MGTDRELARYVADKLSALAVSPQVAAARRDFHAFCEYCFVDEEGDDIIQAPHHRIFHSLVNTHKRVIVWFPVEHGKTVQTAFNLIWLLGHFPSRQYAVVSSKAKQAQKVVGAVKRQIDRNKRIREVFPNLRPMLVEGSTAKEQWGTTAIRVEGGERSPDKDPSLAAYGLDGEISGSRLHGIFIDNALDRKNTATKALREKTVEIIDNEVLTRVLPTGFVALIDTAWTEDDALHTIAGRAGWYSEKFDAERNGKAGATLWPARFPIERLRLIQGTMSKAAYNRMYRNTPLAASVGRFTPVLLEGARRGKWFDRYTGNNPICTGVDLSTGEGEDRTVFATLELIGDRYRLLNIEAGYWEGPEILRRAIDIYQRFHKGNHNAGIKARFRVESNGQQRYIRQLMKSAETMRALGADTATIRSIAVDSHTTTGFNKRDFDFGIPSLADDMEMDRLILPATGEEIETLCDELKAWTPDTAHHTGDSVIALWIAKSGLNEQEIMVGVA